MAIQNLGGIDEFIMRETHFDKRRKEYTYNEKAVHKIIRKLGQLEDIEERYGIEIMTLFKAMVDGCYFLRNGKIEHFVPDENDFACPNLDNESLDLMYASPYEASCRVEVTLIFSEFGKTWALTREELL